MTGPFSSSLSPDGLSVCGGACRAAGGSVSANSGPHFVMASGACFRWSTPRFGDQRLDSAIGGSLHDAVACDVAWRRGGWCRGRRAAWRWAPQMARWRARRHPAVASDGAATMAHGVGADRAPDNGVESCDDGTEVC
ncbi:hypothetical protein GUJ93_ZPchr0014g46655 [Zizania palustris]|uniref:Uncharacterized protein n=1 Tax=Zizania palustris TaxID=103762 RepID=A0A8J5W0H3_ZIZPA|nr:hypothetical protein GUJ93_ZPchr0014g46655 [Zizania palustris]